MAVYSSSASPSVGSLTSYPHGHAAGLGAVQQSFSGRQADRIPEGNDLLPFMAYNARIHTVKFPVMYCFVSVMQAARPSCMADFASSSSFSRARAPALSESCFSFSRPPAASCCLR